MPRFFVKQPNGGYALFSTVVNDFMALGLSELEAIELARDSFDLPVEEVEEVFAKARNDEPFWPSEDHGDGLNRWRQTLTPLAMQHGIEVAIARVREMGIAEETIPEDAWKAHIEVRQRLIR
jgi:hypothetical protein